MNIKSIIKKHEYETLTIFDWFENISNFKSSKSQKQRDKKITNNVDNRL